MISNEIIENSKKKERTSPGPAADNQDKWRLLHGHRNKPPLGARLTDSKVYFGEEFVEPVKDNPSPSKYEKPLMDTLKDKNPSYAIHKSNFPRFEIKEKKMKIYK